MELYERIKYLRTSELKMTQTQFGNYLGVKRDVINNIENNRLKKPESQEPLYRLICEKFNINEDWLRTGSGEIFLKTPDTLIEQLKKKYSIDDFEASIIEEYLNLPSEKRAVFKEFIYKLANKAQTSGDKPAEKNIIRAAHARTDKKTTPEGQKHDWDIMMNDTEWE